MVGRSLVLVAVVAFSAAACNGATYGAPPNIVLVIMDTVRPDHLSVYGYERPTSPFLRDLAASSTRYRNAYSTSAWTFPSHASIFTGLYPAAHSAHWEHLQLDDHLVTLPEVLREAGYRTVGISQNPLIVRSLGFGQGFDLLIDRDDLGATPDVAREFERFLDSRGHEPFFAFANIMAAHAPYNSSGEFFGSFLTDQAYAEQVDWEFDPDFVVGKETLPGELKLHMTAHYDAEIRFVDATIERIANALKEKGFWDSTVFIVTSDHGEALGERGYVRHQFSLYENVIRVPLIVRYPPIFPRAEIASFVQLTDLFPTLLSIAGLRDDYPSQGRSLPIADTDVARPVVAEYYLHRRFQGREAASPAALGSWSSFNRRLQAIRVGEWKLIRGSDGRLELYNLREDPAETQNLSGESGTLAAEEALARLLDEEIAASRARFAPVASLRLPGIAATGLRSTAWSPAATVLRD